MNDKFVWTFIHLSVLVVIVLFLTIVGDIIVNGVVGLDWKFIVGEPERSGRSGGIGPIIVSTLLILAVCISVTLVLGLGTAIFLTEISTMSPLQAKFVEKCLDLLAGVPSIVFGLFGNVFFCKILGLGFSILSGGLTLACMTLPLFVRTTQVGLKYVPNTYRTGAQALGYSLKTTLWQIVLPSAVPGIIAGLVLGIGRALAETAALIFTSGYVDRMPESLMDSGRALSVHIYDLSMNISGGNQNAYKSAFVLILAILVINSVSSAVVQRTFKRGGQ